MTKQTLLQRSNTDRPTSIHLAVLVFCCLPLFNYYGYVLDRSEACIAILATFFSAFFSTRSEKNQPLAVPFALIALAFSPWKILTGLALLPCLVVYGHRWTTKKHSGFLLGILIAGILAAFVWLLDVAAFTPSFQKIRQISPYVVEHAFNLFSVVGLNLYPADSFPLQIGMVIIGVIALIYLTRSKEPLQRGACLSLSASLFLPGLTLAASGAALGLLAVGALSKKAWARMTAVLVLTLFSEVYLVNRPRTAAVKGDDSGNKSTDNHLTFKGNIDDTSALRKHAANCCKKKWDRQTRGRSTDFPDCIRK